MSKIMLKVQEKTLTEQEKKYVVTLRKSGKTLKQIGKKLNVSVRKIRLLLKNVLGDEYAKYYQGNRAEKYRKKLTKEEMSELLKIRNIGKSLREMSKIINSSIAFVKKNLIKAGEKGLKSRVTKQKKVLTKQQIISNFKACYNSFTTELNIDSPRIFDDLKTEAKDIFFDVINQFHSPLFKIELKIPVFVYLFLRDKGFGITFSLLMKISKQTKHECFHMLKKIDGTFSNHVTRNRKQIILEKIRKIRAKFQLDPQLLENANKILRKLWPILCNTTDQVVAGTVSVLALISLQSNSPPYYLICKEIKITQGAVIYQVKKIVSHFGVSGFNTLCKSRELLYKEVLLKVVGR